MTSLRVCAVAGLVLLTFAAASGPVGSNNIPACGSSLTVRDPLLRAQFAVIDRSQPAEFKRLCGAYRQPGAISKHS